MPALRVAHSEHDEPAGQLHAFTGYNLAVPRAVGDTRCAGQGMPASIARLAAELQRVTRAAKIGTSAMSAASSQNAVGRLLRCETKPTAAGPRSWPA